MEMVLKKVRVVPAAPKSAHDVVSLKKVRVLRKK